DVQAADLPGRGDVGAPVGLGVEAHDVDDAYFGEIRREQVGGGADDVGDRVRLLARQHLDVDPPVGGDLHRACGGDGVLEALRHLGQVEVHPGLERLHVAAGDQRAEVAIDDACEQVHRRVGA